MRSHGWSGNPPASDEEAIERILDTAHAIIAQRGSSMRLADVARTLGVTRQTVYRYFPGTDALLLATAMRSADGFLDHLAARVRGITDPVEAMVEGTAFAAETLSDDGRIDLLLSQRQHGARAVSLTSETARTFGRSMLHRFDVDWDSHGYDDAALDELAEFGLRVLHSLLVDPGHTRSATDLRRFLSRWLGPAIVYPKLTQVMDALMPGTTPSARKRGRRASAS
jgi:AcrR family transcriptional regulator